MPKRIKMCAIAALAAVIMLSVAALSLPLLPASAEDDVYCVVNLTTNTRLKVDYKNDYFKSNIYSMQGKVVLLDSDVSPLQIEKFNWRSAILCAPEGGAVKVKGVGWEQISEGYAQASEGEKFTIEIPEGGFLLAGLQVDFAFSVGDEVKFENNSPYTLINKTKGGEINIANKNGGSSVDNVLIYTNTFINKTVAQGPWRKYISAAWSADDGGYKVEYVSNVFGGEGGEPIEIPENGFVLEAHGTGTGYSGSDPYAATILSTEEGDILSFEDKTLALPKCEITLEKGGLSLEIDGKDPIGPDAETSGKAVLFTSDAGVAFTYSRRDSAIEYAVEISGGKHTVIEKHEGTGTRIPFGGYVISLPEGAFNLEEGDEITLSGANAIIAEHKISVDNLTGNIRVSVTDKNVANPGDAFIILNDMPANLTIAGYYCEVPVSYDGASGKYIVTAPPEHLNAAHGTTIPENGFVLSAHGNKVAVIEAFKVGDEIELYDQTAGSPAESVELEISANGVIISPDGMKPTSDNDIMGKIIFYSSRTGSSVTKARKEEVYEIAISVTPDGHFVENVASGTGNTIPYHGYLVSVPASYSDINSVKTAFVAGAEVGFANTTPISIPDRTLENNANDLRVAISKQGGEYEGNDAILYTEGRSAENPWSYDVVVEKADGIYRITKTAAGGNTEVPAGGFIVGGHGTAADLLKLYAVGDEVQLNDFLADYNVTLKSITVDGEEIEGFTPEQKTYRITLPEGSTKVPEIAYQTAIEGQKVNVQKVASVPGDAVLEVTSRNGKAAGIYTVEFRYPLSTDAYLSALTIGGNAVEAFDPTVREYTVKLGYGEPLPQVSATARDAKAKVSVTQATHASPTAVVIVTAEDEDYSMTYRVRFEIVDTSLKSLSVGGAPLEGFDPEITSYEYALKEGQSVPSIVAEANDQGATVQVKQAGGDSDTATITVTNGEYTRVYTIRFAASSESSCRGCKSSVAGSALIALIAGVAYIIKSRGIK